MMMVLMLLLMMMTWIFLVDDEDVSPMIMHVFDGAFHDDDG
jgi:hypothetical protein